VVDNGAGLTEVRCPLYALPGNGALPLKSLESEINRYINKTLE
jgi:hypothetical protein